MPAAFISSEPTIQTLGVDIIQDVQKFTYQAVPSGVVFTFQFGPWPNPNVTAQDIAATANGWADRWNDNASQPGVVGISLAQQVNQAGNLEDVCFVTVSSSSGRSTSQIVGRIDHFFPSIFDPWVAAERALLDAIEAESPPATGLVAGQV